MGVPLGLSPTKTRLRTSALDPKSGFHARARGYTGTGLKLRLSGRAGAASNGNAGDRHIRNAETDRDSNSLFPIWEGHRPIGR